MGLLQSSEVPLSTTHYSRHWILQFRLQTMRVVLFIPKRVPQMWLSPLTLKRVYIDILYSHKLFYVTYMCRRLHTQTRIEKRSKSLNYFNLLLHIFLVFPLDIVYIFYVHTNCKKRGKRDKNRSNTECLQVTQTCRLKKEANQRNMSYILRTPKSWRSKSSHSNLAFKYSMTH